MIQIDHTIVSLDIVTTRFECDLSICRGACCIHGDSGAPLEKGEALTLEELFPFIKPYMRKSGIKAIEDQGNVHMIDNDGDIVTVLIDNKECSFVVFEDNIARCAIEKAYEDGKVSFNKPVSCHLYPARIKKYKDFEGVNYDKWDICKPAIKKGTMNNMPLYVFLQDSFTRKYGKEWYNQLVFVAENMKK